MVQDTVPQREGRPDTSTCSLPTGCQTKPQQTPGVRCPRGNGGCRLLMLLIRRTGRGSQPSQPPPSAVTKRQNGALRSTIPSPTGGRKALRHKKRRQQNEQSILFHLSEQTHAWRIPVTQTSWGCLTTLERHRGIA